MSESQLSTSSVRIRQKQEQVLLELSATVNTLVSIDEVLQDIVALTTTTNSDDDDSNRTNIARKQEMLLKELNQWKDLTLQPSTSRLSFSS